MQSIFHYNYSPTILNPDPIGLLYQGKVCSASAGCRKATIKQHRKAAVEDQDFGMLAGKPEPSSMHQQTSEGCKVGIGVET